MIQLEDGDWQEPQLRQPELLRDVMILPEEVDMPKVTLSEYVRLHRPFYPRFSQEILEAGLQEFDLPLDLNLGAVSMGQKKKALVCFALSASLFKRKASSLASMMVSLRFCSADLMASFTMRLASSSAEPSFASAVRLRFSPPR